MNKRNSLIGPFVIFFILAISFLVLFGWFTGNVTLTSIFPQFTPMNPVTAVSFILIALCFYTQSKGESKMQRICFIATGIFLCVVGGLMLIKYLFGIDLQIDRIFFASKLGINRMAPTTSVNFLLAGISLLLYRRFRIVAHISTLIILCVSVYALLAYLYNFVGVYGQTIYNPMALHTATLFVLSALYFLVQSGMWDGRAVAMLRRKKLFVPAVSTGIFIICLILVGSVWYILRTDIREQSDLRFQSQASQISAFVESRMNLYINVSYGVQGLFAASKSVESDEWAAYAKALNAPVNFSGISGLAYAAKVLQKDVKALPYKIYPFTEKPYYFPLTYSASFTSTTTTTAFGFDYSSSPERNEALQNAIRLNKPVATPIVFGITNHLPLFSVYAPIYKNGVVHDSEDERQAATAGVISVSFRLEKIFPDLMLSPLFDKNIDVQVFDTGDPKQIASSTLLSETHNGFTGDAKSDLMRLSTIPVAGRMWTIRYVSQSEINLSLLERSVPSAVLISGLTFSVLLSLFIATYIRSREKVLAGKNTQLEALVHNFPYGLFIEDEQRKVVLANQKMADTFELNVKVADFVGQDIRGVALLIKPLVKDFAAFMKRAEEIIATKKVVADEKIELLNGNFLSRSYIPLYYANESHGAVWIYKDISEEQKIDQMKTEFVSLASHQLRTPLTSIKWYTELLLDKKESKLSDTQESYVKEIEDGTGRMIDLVNSLLNVSRLELGTFAIEPAQADIIAVMQSAVHEQEPTFAAKKQTFSFKHPNSLPPINIDAKITHIIVQNLLSNAQKYTPEKGSIELSVEQVGTSANNGHLLIACKDSGYGIPKAQQERVFKKLFRADNIRTLDVEGTGLGLYIIKTVVDAAGCDIAFESEENKGTKFTLKIPLSGMQGKAGGKPLSEAKE